MISVFCLTQKCQHGYHQRGLSDRKKFVFCLTQKCHHGYHQRGLSDRKSLCFVWHKNVFMVIINVVCLTEKVCVLSDTKMSSWLSSTWFVGQKNPPVGGLSPLCHLPLDVQCQAAWGGAGGRLLPATHVQPPGSGAHRGRPASPAACRMEHQVPDLPPGAHADLPVSGGPTEWGGSQCKNE